MNTSQLGIVNGKDIPEASATEEVWKDVVGFNGQYQVSQFGNVRSFKHKKPKVIAKYNMKRGNYWKVKLFTFGRRWRYYKVQALVMGAFVGPRPEGLEICHSDGNPKNNHLSNLRYDTRISNIQDAIRHGTHGKHGNSSGLCMVGILRRKLNELHVREILASTETDRALARKYGVCKSNIHQIRNGLNWKWVYDAVRNAVSSQTCEAKTA